MLPSFRTLSPSIASSRATDPRWKGTARGIALACLFTGELLLVLTERTRQTEAKNKVLIPLLLAGASVVAVLFLLPGLHQVMGITPVTPGGWLLAVGTAAVATLWAMPLKRWGKESSEARIS